MSEPDTRKWVTLTFKLPLEVSAAWTRASELAQITGKASSAVEQFEAVCVTAEQEWFSEAHYSTDKQTRLDYDGYQFRNEVRERDGYRCVLCDSTRVDVAHIVPRSAAPERKLDVNNAVCLCRGCHELTGPKWKAYVEPFNAIVAENTANPKWRFNR